MQEFYWALVYMGRTTCTSLCACWWCSVHPNNKTTAAIQLVFDWFHHKTQHIRWYLIWVPVLLFTKWMDSSYESRTTWIFLVLIIFLLFLLNNGLGSTCLSLHILHFYLFRPVLVYIITLLSLSFLVCLLLALSRLPFLDLVPSSTPFANCNSCWTYVPPFLAQWDPTWSLSQPLLDLLVPWCVFDPAFVFLDLNLLLWKWLLYLVD